MDGLALGMLWVRFCSCLFWCFCGDGVGCLFDSADGDFPGSPFPVCEKMLFLGDDLVAALPEKIDLVFRFSGSWLSFFGDFPGRFFEGVPGADFGVSGGGFLAVAVWRAVSLPYAKLFL